MARTDTAEISPKAKDLLYNLEEAINQMWKINARMVTIEKAYADRDAARAAIREYISELEGVREG